MNQAVRAAEGTSGELIILAAYCPTCRQEAMPDYRGRCGFCERRIVNEDTLSARELIGGLVASRVVTMPGLQRCITEPVLRQARELYTSGLSFRQVAVELWPQTTYKTEKSCAEALYSLFRSRGWPTRSLSAVLVARNYKHGRRTRASSQEFGTGGYRRWLKEQRGGYRPVCAATKTGKTGGKGQPCSKPAMGGSDYCYSHDPQLADQRAEHIERMRALSPLENATASLDQTLKLRLDRSLRDAAA